MLKKLRTVIISIFLVIAAVGSIATYQQCRQIRTNAIAPIAEPGAAFADLLPYVGHERAVGYFTDLDFSSESMDTKSFLSAQYQFAPIVLDVNSTHHKFILIDPSSPMAGFGLTEKLGATPIYMNPYGKLLVEKLKP